MLGQKNIKKALKGKAVVLSIFLTAPQEELIKRYLYIYENKDLILSLCINNGIEKEYYKKELKSTNDLIKKIKSIK